MPYVTGFLLPMSADRRGDYLAAAEKSWPLFKEFGALAQHECWGEDIPPGEVTSFPKAVDLKDDEVVVIGWVVWPDRATADAAWAKMQEDERMAGLDMPFDGKRMIYGGFQEIFSRSVEE